MANYTYTTSWFNYNLVTSPNTQFSRLKVDSQQTSFEEGKQFRFYDEFLADDAITSTQQVVYKITTTNAINLFFRALTVHEGGRWYRVYPDDGNVTFTGTLADSGESTPLNPRVSNTTGVTIQRAVGTDIFSTTSNPIDGTMSVADTNASRATPVYSPDEIRAGLAAGQTAWVAMEHLGSTDDLVGQLVYVWEEIFDD